MLWLVLRMSSIGNGMRPVRHQVRTAQSSTVLPPVTFTAHQHGRDAWLDAIEDHAAPLDWHAARWLRSEVWHARRSVRSRDPKESDTSSSSAAEAYVSTPSIEAYDLLTKVVVVQTPASPSLRSRANLVSQLSLFSSSSLSNVSSLAKRNRRACRCYLCFLSRVLRDQERAPRHARMACVE